MRATLRSIAKASHVSVATVSLVLNGKAYAISEETKKRVLQEAQKLDYVPNLAARGLQNSVSNFLLLLVPDLNNSFYTMVANSAILKAQQLGFLLILASLPTNDGEAEKLTKMMRGGQFAGMLVVSRKFDRIRNELVTKNELPFVMLDETIHDAGVHDLVTGDNDLGGFLVAQHLADLGHRKIAFITGPDDTPNSMRRLSGASKALFERNLELDTHAIFEGDYTADAGYALATAVLKTKPTAVFAFNDLMALGFMRYCNEHAISIPEDLSVVGYDAIPIGRYAVPRLTTVDQHADRIGRLGAETLIHKIQGMETDQCILVEPTLITGETTSAPCVPHPVS